MNSYEQKIQRITEKREQLKNEGISLNDVISFTKKQKIKKNKWNDDCLKLYKDTLEVINKVGIVDKDCIIQTFHDSNILNEDNSFNLHNFHEYIKKHEEELYNKLLAHPEKPLQYHSDVRKSLRLFIETVKKEPKPVILEYENMIDEPIELQKELKQIRESFKEKEESSLIKISKEYLDLFLNDDYYKQVERFFYQMYDFCKNDKEYKESIKDERDIKSLREKNKLDFLESLFLFFLISNSFNLNIVLNFSYPIYKKLKRSYNYKSLDIQYNGKYEYIVINESLKFFSDINRINFFNETNNFINVNNKFFNGKISKVEKEFKLNETGNLKVANAVLDYYHMQADFLSIDSLFDFHSRFERSYLAKKLEANLKAIKENLEEKYIDTEYSDIPDLFVKLLEKQEIFYKIDNSKDAENLDDEYFDLFGNSLSTKEKYEKLGGKFNPKGLNKVLENFETIVYNTAVRVADPHFHFPKEQTKDYYKQLTVFFPEVYNFY